MHFAELSLCSYVSLSAVYSVAAKRSFALPKNSASAPHSHISSPHHLWLRRPTSSVGNGLSSQTTSRNRYGLRYKIVPIWLSIIQFAPSIVSVPLPSMLTVKAAADMSLNVYLLLYSVPSQHLIYPSPEVVPMPELKFIDRS